MDEKRCYAGQRVWIRSLYSFREATAFPMPRYSQCWIHNRRSFMRTESLQSPSPVSAQKLDLRSARGQMLERYSFQELLTKRNLKQNNLKGSTRGRSILHGARATLTTRAWRLIEPSNADKF